MLLAVFAATARPYLDRLDAWVSRGELEDDVAGELFIFSGERGYILCVALLARRTVHSSFRASS